MKTIAVFLSLAVAVAAQEKPVKSKTLEYKEGETVCEGYLAWPDGVTGKVPGVIVVHEWMGLGEYSKKRADQLAAMGYVALAADIYGKGVRAANQEEAAKLAGKYRGDRKLLRARIVAALDALRAQESVDSSRIAAIGYCFGGSTVLELARAGADVAGVVSFHGGLKTDMPAEKGTVKAKVLALHGADDPYVPADEVAGFEKEMRDAGIDWQLVAYGGAVHSFTNPGAGSDASKGAAYNEPADRRSWEAMKAFFAELFAKK